MIKKNICLVTKATEEKQRKKKRSIPVKSYALHDYNPYLSLEKSKINS